MPTLMPRDLFKPEVLTPMIERRVQESARWDLGALAEFEQTRRTRVKLNVRAGTLSRLGQFRSDNALTPLSVPRFSAATMEISMPLLSEKEIILEDTLRQLNSVDDDLATEAVAEILDQAERLRIQNINLTRWMVFRALMDTLTVTYPNGSGIDIDYGIENADGGMSASHLPTAGVLWSNAAADVIGDTIAWSTLITNDAGVPQTDLEYWMSSTVWNALQKNTAIQQQVGTVAEPVRPTRTAQVAEVLGIRAINLYDKQYKDTANVTQRYLPENRAILVGRETGGQAIVRVLDGPVVRYEPGTQRLRVGNNPGAVTEVWATPDPPVENIRVTTARMPLVLREGVVCANVR